MATPAAPVPKVKSNRTKPKTRTGCLTCKYRRIKCDEGKPFCMRCQKYGRNCEGYAQLCSKVTSSAKGAYQRPLAIRPDLSSSLFGSEDESRYFQFFCNTTVTRLESHYDPKLWHQLIVQASVRESSIRHMLIAVAALDKVSISLPSCNQSARNGAHHRFALQHYSQALKELRQNVSKGRQDLRTTLISLILVIVLEALQGNYEAALAQIYTGQELLTAWTETRTKEFDKGFVSPSPHTVDDELVRVFNILDIQATIHTDFSSVGRHIRFKDYGLPDMERMPKEFQTVEEAQWYGKVVMRRVAHFLAMVWTYDENVSAALENSYSILDQVSKCSKIAAYVEQDKYLKEVLRWNSAFRPIFEKIRTKTSSKDYHAAICLQVHYLITFVAIVSALATSELFYDSLTSIFIEVVALVKILFTDDDDKEGKFTFAFRGVYPLDMVAKKCRDPRIRREAIDLLLSRPRREIFWDSATMAKVCIWVVGIEEEGMVGTYVTEKARVRNIGTKFLEGKVHVWCQQPKKGDGETEMVTRETIIQL